MIYEDSNMNTALIQKGTGCFNSHFQLEIMPGNFIKEYSYCFSILNEHSNKHPALNKHLSPGQLYQISTPLK